MEHLSRIAWRSGARARPQWPDPTNSVSDDPGTIQRTYREHAVATGGCALCLLKPTQEGRVDGVGPVQAEVAGHRVEATEQVSADGHPHGDTVW